MQWKWIFAALGFAASLSLPPDVLAQSTIPSGTILPLTLDTGLNAAKVRPGQQIRATVMQAVPGTAIRRRARVLGRVVQAGLSKNGRAELQLQFDSVEIDHRMIPMKTNLRALASFVAVEEAQIPEEMSSRGMTPANWTTQQIGGDQFYRGSFVAHGFAKVGQTTQWGALDLARTQPGMPCRGAIGGNHGPQSMWLFSSDACGLYGFDNLRIEHDGRSNPVGIITLTSTGGKLNLGSGAGILLRVSSPATIAASNAGPPFAHQ